MLAVFQLDVHICFCFLLLGVEGAVVMERFLFMLFFNYAVNYNTAVKQIFQHC